MEIHENIRKRLFFIKFKAFKSKWLKIILKPVMICSIPLFKPKLDAEVNERQMLLRNQYIHIYIYIYVYLYIGTLDIQSSYIIIVILFFKLSSKRARSR